MRRTTRTLALALVLTTPASSFAQGGPARRLLQRLTGRSPRVETFAATAPVAAALDPGGDPHGFAGVINAIRARAGLAPLRYDPDLSAWASRNNAAMCRRGLGHHVVPGCHQNCGWNYTDPHEVAQGWMDSPGHRANMLHPTATTFGIAYGPGPYWTLNLR